MKSDTDIWGKLKAISAVVATILVPITIVVIGNDHSSAMKEADTKTKRIEFAVDILKELPNENNVHIRSWAIDVITEYSDIPMAPLAKAELLKESLFKKMDDYMLEYWTPAFMNDFITRSSIIDTLASAFESKDTTTIKITLFQFYEAAYGAIKKKERFLREEIQKGKNLPESFFPLSAN